jgi:hypothetical protein
LPHSISFTASVKLESLELAMRLRISVHDYNSCKVLDSFHLFRYFDRFILQLRVPNQQ